MQTEINKTHYWLKSPKKIKQKISPKKNYLKKQQVSINFGYKTCTKACFWPKKITLEKKDLNKTTPQQNCRPRKWQPRKVTAQKIDSLGKA